MGADWKEVDGSVYANPVLSPTTAVIKHADWLTDSGVEPVILLELSGTLEERPVTIAVELSNDAAGKISRALAKAMR